MTSFVCFTCCQLAGARTGDERGVRVLPEDRGRRILYTSYLHGCSVASGDGQWYSRIPLPRPRRIQEIRSQKGGTFADAMNRKSEQVRSQKGNSLKMACFLCVVFFLFVNAWVWLGSTVQQTLLHAKFGGRSKLRVPIDNSRFTSRQSDILFDGSIFQWTD